jgi:catechol 2,3-dioxygenase-like lactoylglutathione lyase family enzyme
MHYEPPTAEALENLKDALGKSSTEMADLFGLSTGRAWRRYTTQTVDPDKRREMGAHMLFFAMARLELDAEAIARVLERMRQAGATIDLSESAGDSGSSQG